MKGGDLINDFKISDNFKLKEFECTHPDHHHVILDDTLRVKIQKLREYWEVPITFNSAYRCEERNEEVGGSLKSQHLLGRAVDVPLSCFEVPIEEVHESALIIGFTGIGLYDTFIHLDVRHGPFAFWDFRTKS